MFGFITLTVVTPELTTESKFKDIPISEGCCLGTESTTSDPIEVSNNNSTCVGVGVVVAVGFGVSVKLEPKYNI